MANVKPIDTNQSYQRSECMELHEMKKIVAENAITVLNNKDKELYFLLSDEIRKLFM